MSEGEKKEQKEKPKRRRGVRPTYKLLSDRVIQSDVAARCPVGSPFFDWLTEIRLDTIEENTDFGRGLREGMRRLAQQIQDYVLADQQ